MRAVHYTASVEYDSAMMHHSGLLFHDHFHKHNEMQVTLIEEGEGTLIVNNYTQRFTAGNVFIIGANEPHLFKMDACYYRNERQVPRAIHILIDHENKISDLINLPELEPIQQFLGRPEKNVQLHSRFLPIAQKKINTVNGALGLKRLLALMDLLNFFAVEATQWKSLSTGLEKHPQLYGDEGMRISRIYQYAKENYMEEIPLETIAGVAHLSPTAFCKYFKKHTMKTWLLFLNEIRIHEVCRKIIRNGDSIGAAAYTSGFNNLITFNRVFRKITGMCPGTYLKKYRHQPLQN